MPFAEDIGDVKERVLLTRVFDSAWEQLKALHTQTAQPHNAEAAREELGKRIVEAYRNGERNPETLKLVALGAFDRWIARDQSKAG